MALTGGICVALNTLIDVAPFFARECQVCGRSRKVRMWPDNKYQGNGAFLVANTANYTLALSLDAPAGKPAESMRPVFESPMRGIWVANGLKIRSNTRLSGPNM